MTRLLVIAIMLAVGLAALQTWRLAELRDQVAADRAAAAELARTTERQLSARTQEIDRDTQTRLQASRAAAAVARADADGMRDALAARAGADPAPAGCADVAADRDRLAGLLGQAAGLAADCQEHGQQLADQVIGLQAWATHVCAP